MLEGDLTDFSLGEILQLLGYSRKSGRLLLHGPRHAGRMILAEGQLMDVTPDVTHIGVVRRLLGLGYLGPAPIIEALEEAEVLPSDRELLSTLVERGHLDLEVAQQVGRNHALESLWHLLRWPEGAFRFEADPDAAEGINPDLALSIEQVMEDARERVEGWDALTERVGPGGQVVQLTSPMPPRDVTIPSTSWGVLMFVDGKHTIDDIAALSGRGAYDTRVALIDLLDQGLVALSNGDTRGEGGLAEAIARIEDIEARRHPGAAADAAGAFGAASVEDDDTLVLPDTGPDSAAEDAEVAAADARAAWGDELPALSPDEPPAPSLDEPPAPSPDDRLDAPPAPPAAEEGRADLTAVAADVASSDEASSGLRTKVRADRLRTDPSIDDDLIDRLIDGVEEL